MHVFIDTNILLNFFHYSNDELDALNNVFAPREHGEAEVHLTQQVLDEYTRNRESKIKEALKRFRDSEGSYQLPSFMKGYGEYPEIQELAAELRQKTQSIVESANADIANRDLAADRLIKQIFDSHPGLISICARLRNMAIQCYDILKYIVDRKDSYKVPIFKWKLFIRFI